jgi:hypothetical protein
MLFFYRRLSKWIMTDKKMYVIKIIKLDSSGHHFRKSFFYKAYHPKYDLGVINLPAFLFRTTLFKNKCKGCRLIFSISAV